MESSPASEFRARIVAVYDCARKLRRAPRREMPHATIRFDGLAYDEVVTAFLDSVSAIPTFVPILAKCHINPPPGETIQQWVIAIAEKAREVAELVLPYTDPYVSDRSLQAERPRLEAAIGFLEDADRRLWAQGSMSALACPAHKASGDRHDRIFVDDIESFEKVISIRTDIVSHFLKEGFLDWSEDDVQRALEEILGVPWHKTDWGGEANDLYTANLVVSGRRVETAFLLKGNGLRAREMTIADCGKNGDQLVRLFDSPAELFVVQYVGNIAEMIIKDVRDKVASRRAQGTRAQFLIMDGQETARVLHAYGKL